ncbi:MAG: putative glycoside hydrolase [Eubacteriales bacterium]|nr:putative glycoside hydrolase [Eubacteriales bacterium]
MKKKRFYNNKKRNTKWTEPAVGRKIDFADKYIDAGTGSDKYDSKRPKKRKKRITADKARKVAKNIIVVVCCFLIVSAGYTLVDFYMERNSMPAETDNAENDTNISNLSININSIAVQSLSLDGGVMLDAVITNAQEQGYSCVTFDLKRDDGTVGYESKLATIDAYGAVSSASSDLEESVSKMTESDLLPVARISCYKDNIAPTADLTAAVTKGTSVYRDADGFAYLNPDSSVTYNYIKGIIEETKGLGISVFVLDNTELPDEIAEGYNDGFAVLTKKLHADFGDEIKFLSAIDVDATVAENNTEKGENDEYSDSTQPSLDEEFEKLLTEKIPVTAGSNAVYYITTNKPDAVKEYLSSKNIKNYIIAVQTDA